MIAGSKISKLGFADDTSFAGHQEDLPRNSRVYSRREKGRGKGRTGISRLTSEWINYTSMKRIFRHFHRYLGIFSESRLTNAVFRGIFPLEFCNSPFGYAEGFKFKVFYDWRNVAV